MTVVDDALTSPEKPSVNPAHPLHHGLSRVVALAESGLFDDYVVYEDRGTWIFAGGVAGSIILTSDVVTSVWRDAPPVTRSWFGSPSSALQQACGELTDEAWNAYGWVGFSFATHTYNAVDIDDNDSRDDVLAHLIIPETEIRFDCDVDGVVTVSGSEESRDAVLSVLSRSTTERNSVPENIDVTVDLDRYRERAATAIAEIRRGTYSKVILSRQVQIPFEVDMPNTYRLGRGANTPARSFLLKLNGVSAAGYSPELVVAVDDRNVVTTEPLAGTRAFGLGAEPDAAARIDLEQDPKEITEHAVSVRTSFQELESVARLDSTAVTDFMSVRERGSVQHLASTVRADLREDLSPWDAFAALFPAVTASGIPKREAIEAIQRLDDTPRGLYSGAVIKTSSDGSLEAALVLRAVYEHDGAAWLRAGAGLVVQSEPDREFEETCEKLRSVSPYLVRRAESVR